MKKLKYVGPHDGIDLPGVGTVLHGETVQVSAAVAKRLGEQPDNWELVSPPRRRTRPTATSTKSKES